MAQPNKPRKKRTLTKHFKSNLGDRIKRQMPPGVESRVYRVQAPTTTLDTWEAMTPKQRGDTIQRALGHNTSLTKP